MSDGDDSIAYDDVFQATSSDCDDPYQTLNGSVNCESKVMIILPNAQGFA
jgi:hypothetical protein